MKKALIAAAVAAFSSTAMAIEPHSYNYVELGWFDRTEELDVGLPNDELEGDGYSLAGSFRAESGVLFQFNYSDGEIDRAWGEDLSGTGVSADYKKYGVLVGAASQATERTSFWGGVGFDREELEVAVSGFGSDTAEVDEIHFGGGVRHSLVDMLELNAGLRAIHFRGEDDNDSDVEVSAGLRFQPVSLVSIGASYSRLLDFETEIVKADVRLQF